jgi:Fe-S-cluster containining protein
MFRGTPMQSSPKPSGEGVPLQVEIALGSFHFRGTVALPVVPTKPRDLVPLALALADALAEDAVRRVAAEGGKVSCKKGCAACCRYLVHVSESEAHYLYEMVERLPEPHHSRVRERFAEAGRRLQQAGFLETLRQFPMWTGREIHERGQVYHNLQIPCPFLEEESCSVYADRPIACREYLVTSPPEYCATADRTAVHGVTMPVSFFIGLARFGVPTEAKTLHRWVPLVLALEWAESQPDSNPSRPAEQVLNEFIEHLEMRHPKEAPAPAGGEESVG